MDLVAVKRKILDHVFVRGRVKDAYGKKCCLADGTNVLKRAPISEAVFATRVRTIRYQRK